VSFPSLSDAIRAGQTDLPYLFSPVPGGEDTKAEHIATFQFVTAPRDVVAIGVAHQATGWKVVCFKLGSLLTSSESNRLSADR